MDIGTTAICICLGIILGYLVELIYSAFKEGWHKCKYYKVEVDYLDFSNNLIENRYNAKTTISIRCKSCKKKYGSITFEGKINNDK